ncbi:MAG: NFACT family protein [Methanomicrobiales archaeon]|nr:NFACT family protein [Methanomicrobiales archaeon]
MSGIDVLAMVEELKECLPLWIGKVYQFGEKTIGIRLGGEQEKNLFLIEAGRRAHLVGTLPAAPKNPTGFAMLLRKYLEGGKVLSIGQYGIERIFYFDIGKREQIYRLIIELFDEGNVILCREDGTIIMPLWHHRFRDRDVIKDASYVRTGRDCTDFGPEEFSALLENTTKDLVKALAVDCRLGGMYAEEVCRMAGVDKHLPAPEAEAESIYRTLHALLHRITAESIPVITASGCWPIILDAEVPLRTFDSYHQALDAYYPREEPAKEEQKARVTRQESIRSRQMRAVAGFEEKIDRIQRKIDALYANYLLVEEILHSLQDARTRHSWQEIAHRLHEAATGAARRIVQVYPEEAAVEIDLGERVKVFVADSVETNAVRYYDQIKKLKKKREGALSALEKPVVEKATGGKRPGSAKPRWYHRFRWFYTSDDVLVVGGKDASQNEELVKKYLEGGDTFLHAESHGASVMVVKGVTLHPEEAAQAAVSYSGAWRSGRFSGDAYAAAPEQVSKTPPSGEYISRGSFVVRGERIHFHDVPLRVAIGLQVEPMVKVIGGPPSTIQKHARIWVGLHPGQFEPNDIAKKVVRLLKEKAQSLGVAGIARIITTESVAAFVPPGGSDIEET